MSRFRSAALGAAIVGLAGGGVAAQTAGTPPGASPAIPEKTAPGSAPATNLDAKPGTLSDKLKDTNGVIRPTGDVDPDMHKATPQTGTTPVIRPGEVPPQTGKGGSQ